ncbi:MAG TPA: ERCC4 domain-containing protein [Kiritimatiellia bacterium]|nr:ERCC4 domain-containing protein [Kiritimatiellia bacterium]
MTERIQVVADDRERPSGIPGILTRQDDLDLRIERLPVGDYLVDEAVVIERKSAADFAQSIVDGRLFAQATRLTISRFRPALIIVGSAAEWSAIGVPRHAIQGALVTLMLIYDIPLFRAVDGEEAARLILYIGRQLARLRDPNLVTHRVAKSKHRRARQLRILQHLPGVGPERAFALLEHFGSVRACLSATEEDLGKIRGIGPTTARRIVETVKEPRTTYGFDENTPPL